jgi:hypothetical protein
MTTNIFVSLLIAAVIAFLGFAFWYQRQYPREIIGTSTISVEGVRGTKALTLKTRDVSINGVVFREVEMPNGTWIDCAGDCTKAARNAGDGFWADQNSNKR